MSWSASPSSRRKRRAAARRVSPRVSMTPFTACLRQSNWSTMPVNSCRCPHRPSPYGFCGTHSWVVDVADVGFDSLHYRSAQSPRIVATALGGAMDDARVFVCARCRLRVRICSRCDRGHRYCSARCSDIARRDAVREASRRFQQSRRGKLLHAERQRKYRIKCREGEKKVTQQGSGRVPRGASLSRAQRQNPDLDPSVASERTAKTRCHFCKRPVSPLAGPGWRKGSGRAGERSPMAH